MYEKLLGNSQNSEKIIAYYVVSINQNGAHISLYLFFSIQNAMSRLKYCFYDLDESTLSACTWRTFPLALLNICICLFGEQVYNQGKNL